MKTNLSKTVGSFLATRKKNKETRITTALALEMNKCFERLSMTVKEGEFVNSDYRAITEDYKQFLSDNTEDYSSQNINRILNYKRATWLLWAAILLSSILAVKGLMFFSESFYGPISPVAIFIIAIALAFFFVKGSIYLNTFAVRYQEDDRWKFYFSKIAAFVVILLIPSMNIFEGINSHYSPAVMALNIFTILVDIILNSTLVVISDVFIVSENAKSAKKEIMKKTKAKQSADQRYHSFNEEFLNKKNAFADAAKQFVINFKKLQQKYPDIVENILYIVDNFTIFMVNNKVFQHAVLPYHTDENGHPVVEGTFFSPGMDSIRVGYEQLSKVNFFDDPLSQTRANSADEEDYLPDSTPKEAATVSGQAEIIKSDGEAQPSDYDSVIENNRNDKYL